jgi:type IV secretory pathway component VirB8
MDFDDFFENKHRNHGNYREQSNHDYTEYSNNSHHSYTDYGDHHRLVNILQAIRSSKKLKILVLVAGILLLVISIVLIITLLPLIIKLINYIGQNGLQGLYNEITGFLEKIWKGPGK